MRIFKGLENIHSIIDKHEIEWRKEQGEPVEDLPEFSIEEAVRRRLTKSTAEGSGKFSADRFLGASASKKKAKSGAESNVEVVDVIKQKDGKPHSWLYNEVLKAIQDATANSRNTKVVAVFIPVVQNGKEFEDLPFDASVTLPPVDEEDINFKDLIKNSENSEAEQAEAEAGQEEAGEIPEEVIEEIEEKPEEPEEPEAEQEGQPEHSADFNLIPEGQDKPDAELAEAFSVMEEKLDEALSDNKEPEPETEPEQEPEPEISESLSEEVPADAEFETSVSEDGQDDSNSDILEVPANEVLDFEEFPVIKEEETDTPLEVEDVIEEITPEEDEEGEEDKEKEEPQEELPPLDDLEDDEIFEEHEAVEKTNTLPEDEHDGDNEEIIRLDLGE